MRCGSNAATTELVIPVGEARTKFRIGGKPNHVDWPGRSRIKSGIVMIEIVVKAVDGLIPAYAPVPLKNGSRRYPTGL